MRLDELQRRIEEILAPIAHPRVGAGLAVAEETGELCRLLLEHECYGRALKRDRLEAELADVLVCLCEIATLYEIDLGAAAAAKVDDLEQRAPGWEGEFGAALEEARARMDRRR